MESQPAATNNAASSELARVLERMMATPEIRAEEGFTARVLVPPGEMYDPLFMHDHEGAVWVNDDGGQEGDRGGLIHSIDAQGNVTSGVALGRLLPVTGFDFAPPGFGDYGGHIFTIAQPEVSFSGAGKNHVIQRVDPATADQATEFCTLPAIGKKESDIAGFGVDARFGPEGSPFAHKFFATSGQNKTIYQVTADGRCSPFVTFKGEWGAASVLSFSPDGQYMLASTRTPPEQATGGGIARIRPDGVVEAKPLLRDAQLSFSGMAYAPASFGDYGGQLFVSAFRRDAAAAAKVQQTHAAPALGEIYRLTPEGELKRVAAGLHGPLGLHFVGGDRLWVTDVNADFIAGTRRELPDGFLVEIALAQ